MPGVEPPLARVGPLVHKALCCLRCGGFAGFTSGTKGPIGYGRAVSKLVNMEHADILGFYSRTLEEFGSSKLTRYLLRDSLACTLAQKHKLNTRAAAYRTLGASLLGIPVPSADRPRRYQADRTAPMWPCNYSGGCKIGHGPTSMPMFNTLREAVLHDKDVWGEADARAAERVAARVRAEPRADSGAAALHLDVLRETLERRTQARLDCDFELADRLRVELRAGGFHVNDKDNRWEAADGRSGTVAPFVFSAGGWKAPHAEEGTLGTRLLEGAVVPSVETKDRIKAYRRTRGRRQAR